MSQSRLIDSIAKQFQHRQYLDRQNLRLKRLLTLAVFNLIMEILVLLVLLLK